MGTNATVISQPVEDDSLDLDEWIISDLGDDLEAVPEDAASRTPLCWDPVECLV
jgi:hypothetical protein